VSGAREARRLHIDALRILAILLVLYNHTGERGFMRFAGAQGPARLALMALSMLDKIAVPLFFMISGALLLPRDEPIRAVLTRRVARYALVLVGASGVSYLYACRGDLPAMSAADFLRTLYGGEHATAYWFLYAYLAFLLMLPLMRRMARGMTEREFFYATGLIFAVHVFSAAEWFVFRGEVTLNANFALFATRQAVYYPLAGYFLEHRLGERVTRPRALAGLLAAGALAVALSCATLLRAHAVTGEWPESVFGLFVFAPAMAVYAAAKALFARVRVSPRAARAITGVGSCTFGIFLFEKVYRDVSSRVYHALELIVGGFPACLAWVCGAFLLGLTITALWKIIKNKMKNRIKNLL